MGNESTKATESVEKDVEKDETIDLDNRNPVGGMGVSGGTYFEGKYVKKILAREYLESDIKSPMVFSMDAPDMYQDLLFGSPQDDVTGIHNLQNYGILPLGVLRNILLFTHFKNLGSVCLTCRLFYRIGNSETFWKTYYSLYFGEEQTRIVEDLSVSNWKKQFILCYYFKEKEERIPDLLPQKEKRRVIRFSKIHPECIEKPPEIRHHRQIEWIKKKYPICQLGIIGDVGIGKKSFCSVVIKDFPWCGDKTKEEECRHQWIEVTNNYGSMGYPQKFGIIITDRTSKHYTRVLKHVNCILLCFSLTDRQSFKNLELYLQDINTFCPTINKREHVEATFRKDLLRLPILIIGLKSDIEFTERKTKPQEVLNLVKKYRLKGYLESSPHQKTNCYYAFSSIIWKFNSQTVYLKRKSKTKDVARAVESSLGSMIEGAVVGISNMLPQDIKDKLEKKIDEQLGQIHVGGH